MSKSHSKTEDLIIEDRPYFGLKVEGAADPIYEKVDDFLRHGGDPNRIFIKIDVDYIRIAIWAAKEGRADIIRILIGKNAKFYITREHYFKNSGPKEASPLALAVNNKHERVVQLLLMESVGLDIDYYFDLGDHENEASLGVQNSYKLKGSLLTLAASVNISTKLFKEILKRSKIIDAVDGCGYTALHHAAIHGAIDKIELLSACLDDKTLHDLLTHSKVTDTIKSVLLFHKVMGGDPIGQDRSYRKFDFKFAGKDITLKKPELLQVREYLLNLTFNEPEFEKEKIKKGLHYENFTDGPDPFLLTLSFLGFCNKHKKPALNKETSQKMVSLLRPAIDWILANEATWFNFVKKSGLGWVQAGGTKLCSAVGMAASYMAGLVFESSNEKQSKKCDEAHQNKTQNMLVSNAMFWVKAMDFCKQSSKELASNKPNVKLDDVALGSKKPKKSNDVTLVS